MNHPAELALHQYMSDAVNGNSTMSETTINQVATDVADALKRQFGGGKSRDDFKLRMSNVGRPNCQLWYAKNKPEVALPFPTTFIMNMMLGDIVEAVFKGLLKEAGVDLITIGQYLAPSSKHLAVDRFPEPDMYDQWAQHAIAIGFSGIASGPLVRSSFKAGLLLRKTQDPNNSESMPGAYVYVASQGNEAPVHLKSGME